MARLVAELNLALLPPTVSPAQARHLSMLDRSIFTPPGPADDEVSAVEDLRGVPEQPLEALPPVTDVLPPAAAPGAPEAYRPPTIHELPAEDRPREKLAARGASALTEAELIAILLRTGRQGASALDMARTLISTYGSLNAVARCSLQELARVKGIGYTKGCQLAAAFELATRVAREKLVKQRMDRPEMIYELLGAEMRMLQKESLRVVLLDTKHHHIGTHQISLGSLNESIAHPREIFQPVLLYSAYAFVLVHNHPSGDPTPSEADRKMTMRLAEAARLLQVRMHDHLIVGAEGPGRRPYFSFAEAGLL